MTKSRGRKCAPLRPPPDAYGYSFSSHPILLHSSNVMYLREHFAPLHHCQYVFLDVIHHGYFKIVSSVASNIWNALPIHLSYIPTLPAFRRALKHHLFLLAFKDSSAKSGKIKPAQCITLCDTTPTTAIAQPSNTIPSSTVQLKAFHLSAYD